MKLIQRLLKIDPMRRFRRATDGVVAVEFAMVVVPFLMLVFGIFETGQVLWASSQIDFHVDRIVREAAVDSSISNAEILSAITTSLGDLDADHLTVAVSRANGTPDVLSINVTYTHMPVTPFLFEDGIVLNHSSSYPMIDF